MKGSLQECVDAILMPLLSSYGHASILSLWWLDASCMLILPYINLALNWFWWNIKQINVKSPLNAAPIAYFANEMWGLCTAASQNPISCSCLSVYPWLRRSFTCDRSVSIICTSRPISNSNGIKVMKEVEAITKPTYSAFWPSHRVWVDSHVPPLVKDTDAFWKNPLIPPTTGSDFLTMVCCVLCFSTAMAQQIKKLEF